MKPFDLELAKKGEKVITRCGFEALLCGEDNIPRGLSLCDVFPLAVYLYDKYDNLLTCESFTKSGKFCDGDSEFDLFMAEDSDFEPKAEKPVYYRGDEERNNEIIADLEKRGGKDVDDCTGSLCDCIYFINQFGLIDVAYYDDVRDSIDKFTELHLPPKKIKKEGWMNLYRSKIDKSYWSEGVYDSENEAKNKINVEPKNIECLKTYKIDWEEETK